MVGKMKAGKRGLHAGGLFGIILLASMAMHLVVSLWIKSDVFHIRFLDLSQIVSRISLCLGIIMLILGSVLGAIAHETFKRAIGRDGEIDRVIEDGPFELVRHPFYLSLVLICFALLLFFKSYILLAALLAVAFILVGEAQGEEAILTERFGEEYLSYKKTTGMFLPKMISKRSATLHD